MAKLFYGMGCSLDLYTEDANGNFGWGADSEPRSHEAICEFVSPFGTLLYGRKIYESMVYWETADQLPNQPDYLMEFARRWKAADKIVFSRTMAEPRSQRTRVERAFDADAICNLKARAGHDLLVAGTELGAQCIRAGLVDGLLMIVYPVLAGGGKRFFPEGLQLNLEQTSERRLPNGVLLLRYAVRR